ncbi:MAG: N-acetylmuramoyl-L-alanine amidase, partial [Propionicimonas sp.]|nr:N-acetylmuramoyl-L-alanine amidase [Propionicimonas sp.]
MIRRRQPGKGAIAVLPVAMLLSLGGCSAPPPAPGRAAGVTASPTASSPSPAPASAPPTTTLPTASAGPAASPTPGPLPLAGTVVVVDPGHNGRYRKAFNTRAVPAGNGRTKACNSSGTAGKGMSEHAYNWEQADALRTALRELGAEVVLTRDDDNGLGPCVNLRAKVANDAAADLLVSIHADGNLTRGARGFHVIVSTSMAGGPRLERASR